MSVKQRVLVETLWRCAVLALATWLQSQRMLVIRPVFGARIWLPVGGGFLRVDLSGAAILAGFWIVAGAILHAVTYKQRLLLLLPVRAIALLAGSAAVLACEAMVAQIAHAAWPMEFSMAVVSLFSLAVYGSWRWVSLLLAAVQAAGGFAAGWRIFAQAGVALALEAASNSTLKWFFLALTAMPGLLLWRRGPWVASALSAPLMAAVSGYFAVRLRDSIAGQSRI